MEDDKKIVKLGNRKFEIGDTFNPYGLFVGSFVPQWLESRTEISPGAKLTYARMCRHAGERGDCKPNQNLLAAEIGLKKRQTQAYIQELEAKGLVRTERRGQGRSNRYHFLIHEWMFEKLVDVRDAAYQSINDVQDTAYPDVQDTAYPYHYKKRIKENKKAAPKNDIIPPKTSEPKNGKKEVLRYAMEWDNWKVEQGDELFLAARGETPIFHADDMKAFCRLRENGKRVDEITERYKSYLADSNSWYVTNGYSFSVFVKNYASFSPDLLAKKAAPVKNGYHRNGHDTGDRTADIAADIAKAVLMERGQRG